MPPLASHETVVRPTPAVPARELPHWARAVFPDGLLWENGQVWSPPAFVWDMDEDARITAAAASRSAGGPEVMQHFEDLLSAALARVTDDRLAERTVIDLRSGAGGRSVGPLLRLLPHARIVASDPSSVLLASLGGLARSLDAEDRIVSVIADADRLPAAPGTADLVSGAYCLQEMDDPDRVIAAAARMLRPGGHAVFLAPFDGHGVLRLAYERILAEAALWPDAPLAPDVATGLRTLAGDIAQRTMTSRDDPAFGDMDQKWLFAREAVEAAARASGFRDVAFVSHHDHETLYRDMGVLQLRAWMRRADADLPDWALAVLDGFDRALPPPVKRLLMLEGTVVLRR